MRPARRPATSAPRPSWQKRAPRTAGPRAKPRGASLRRAALAEPTAAYISAPKVAAAISRCSASRSCATSVRSLKPRTPSTSRRSARAPAGRSRRRPARPSAPLSWPRPPEEQRGQNEGRADDAREQPVGPLPPEDGLEPIQRHVRVELGVLRDLLVAVELGLPVGAAQRGMTPVTGFHCVIERPDSVSRVAPPTSTMRKTRAATATSQTRTAAVSKKLAVWAAAGELWVMAMGDARGFYPERLGEELKPRLFVLNLSRA